MPNGLEGCWRTWRVEKEGIRLLRMTTRFPRRQCRNTVEILLWPTVVTGLTRLVQAEPLDNDKKKRVKDATPRTKKVQNMSFLPSKIQVFSS